MANIDEAWAEAATTQELYIDFRDGDVLDARIGAFKALESLQLRNCPPTFDLPREVLALDRLRCLGVGARENAVTLPPLVTELPITRLELWDTQADAVPSLPRLEELYIVVKDPAAETRELAKRFPHLKVLELWGSHLKTGTLPDEIASFTRLEVLHLVSCGLSALPEALAKVSTLRELALRGVPMTTFPEVLCRMPGLGRLQLHSHIIGLPPELPKMTGLRELDLANALNKGAMVSRFDEIDKLKPLPKVLSEMTALQTLRLDSCGVFDAAPLRPLKALESLSMKWTAIRTLDDIAELTSLQVLVLENMDRVEDLAPLARLQQLRELNLESVTTESLDVLRELKSLKKLNISRIECERIDALFDIELDELEADDEIKERYAARAKLRLLPPIDTMLAALGTGDISTVEKAFGQLSAWALASSTGDENPLASRLAPIDAALAKHLAQLSAQTLAELFAALFQKTEHDFAAASLAAEQVVRRGDDAAQLRLVEAFEKANEYYDTGHRELSDSVHDRLIDEFFPELGGPAITRLLAWCSDGHLDEDQGDQMLPLFEKAFLRASGADALQLLERLGTYVNSRLEYSGGSDIAEHAWTLIPAGVLQKEVGELRQRIDARLSKRKQLDQWSADIDSKDASKIRAAVVALAALPDKELKENAGLLWSATRAEAATRETRALLLRLWLRAGEGGLAELVAALAQRDGIAAAREELAQLALDKEKLGALLRKAILKAQPDVVAGLRAWASELDGVSDLHAQSRELVAAIARAASDFDGEALGAVIKRLAAMPQFDLGPGFEIGKVAGELADMIGMTATDEDTWPTLRALAHQLPRLGIKGTPLQRILAQLVGVCVVSGDAEATAVVLPLVPDPITWDILAYNLCCLAARTNDRPRLLTYTKRALELGKSPTQFLGDSDFEPFLGDSEWKALLDKYA